MIIIILLLILIVIVQWILLDEKNQLLAISDSKSKIKLNIDHRKCIKRALDAYNFKNGYFPYNKNKFQ